METRYSLFTGFTISSENFSWEYQRALGTARNCSKKHKRFILTKIRTLVGFKDLRTNYYLLQKDKDLVTILKFPRSFSSKKKSSCSSTSIYTFLGSPDFSMIVLMTSCSIALLVFCIGLRRRAQRRAKEKLYIKEKVQSVIFQQRRRSRLKSMKLS